MTLIGVDGSWKKGATRSGSICLVAVAIFFIEMQFVERYFSMLKRMFYVRSVEMPCLQYFEEKLSGLFTSFQLHVINKLINVILLLV